MRKTTSHRLQLLFILVIAMLNLGTFYYCAPLQENLSYLGNTLGHRMYLLLWAMSAATYFFWYTRRLMQQFSYTNRIGWVLLYAACIGMVLSVCLPYDPLTVPELSKWHTRLAMWSTIGYVLLFFHLLMDILKKNYMFFQKSFSPFLLLVLFDCLLFLLNGGVSTVLEVTFTIGMSVYLFYVRLLIDKSECPVLDDISRN